MAVPAAPFGSTGAPLKMDGKRDSGRDGGEQIANSIAVGWERIIAHSQVQLPAARGTKFGHKSAEPASSRYKGTLVMWARERGGERRLGGLGRLVRLVHFASTLGARQAEARAGAQRGVKARTASSLATMLCDLERVRAAQRAGAQPQQVYGIDGCTKRAKQPDTTAHGLDGTC